MRTTGLKDFFLDANFLLPEGQSQHAKIAFATGVDGADRACFQALDGNRGVTNARARRVFHLTGDCASHLTKQRTERL